MKNSFQKLTHYFDSFAKENPFTWVYGAARTALALSTLITFLFSSHQVLFDEFLFGRLSLDSFFNTINYFFLFGYENLFLAKILAIGILILVISGFYPRFTGIFQWWVTFSYFQAGATIEGGDQIAAIVTALLIPVTLLDNRRNHWDIQESKSLLSNFTAKLFLLIVALQMAVIYFHSAVEKLYKVPEWTDGTAVYYFFKDSLFGYPDWMNFLLEPLLLGKTIFFITWSVILLELLLFCALFMNLKRRKYLFVLAVVFHIFIALIFGLVSFFFAVLGGLIIYLIPAGANPNEYKVLIKMLRPKNVFKFKKQKRERSL